MCGVGHWIDNDLRDVWDCACHRGDSVYDRLSVERKIETKPKSQPYLNRIKDSFPIVPYSTGLGNPVSMNFNWNCHFWCPCLGTVQFIYGLAEEILKIGEGFKVFFAAIIM